MVNRSMKLLPATQSTGALAMNQVSQGPPPARNVRRNLLPLREWCRVRTDQNVLLMENASPKPLYACPAIVPDATRPDLLPCPSLVLLNYL